MTKMFMRFPSLRWAVCALVSLYFCQTERRIRFHRIRFAKKNQKPGTKACNEAKPEKPKPEWFWSGQKRMIQNLPEKNVSTIDIFTNASQNLPVSTLGDTNPLLNSTTEGFSLAAETEFGEQMLWWHGLGALAAHRCSCIAGINYPSQKQYKDQGEGRRRSLSINKVSAVNVNLEESTCPSHEGCSRDEKRKDDTLIDPRGRQRHSVGINPGKLLIQEEFVVLGHFRHPLWEGWESLRYLCSPMPPLSSRAAFSSTRRMQRAHGVPFFPLGHPAESCIPPLEPRMQTSTGALTWAAARIPLDGLAADHFEPRSCPHASRSRHVNATVVSGGDAPNEADPKKQPTRPCKCFPAARAGSRCLLLLLLAF
ncbi:hypothetical protein Anapl_12125 [Anas platyrhynchos]|uniref:Uncharacterized protein n=1 Tax=Anas platyrhynchos TaxID=8839 RepID=R0LNU3_ANAPL|nr:hypothetical protein Anapl_12125 [Anas platyrhynchos]